jgi:predicted nucleic acid-binding protein
MVIVAMNGKVILAVDAVTVAEVFYALRSIYGMTVRDVPRLLSNLLDTSAFELLQRKPILGALERLQAVSIDFADGYLAALANHHSMTVASFDRDFDRFKDVARFEP